MQRSSLYGCAENMYKLNSSWLGSKDTTHEIEIQDTRTNHRQHDSQATLSQRARILAFDVLRSQVWSLRPPRRDNDPGRLSARSAGVRGLRPTMAADRIIRGPATCSACQKRDCQRASNPRR